MAAELLLINPRGRRKAARKSPKRRRTVRRTVTVAAAHKGHAVRRRRNPIAGVRARVMRSRRRVSHRRRRNPISLGSSASWIAMLKDAAIGGAGAIAIDVLMGQINPQLPLSMRVSPTEVGIGDAVKAAITVAFGMLLKKPTRGMSQKMALGALTVQAAEIARTFVPATIPMAGARLGYSVPAQVANRSARVGPNRLQAYTSGATPLLNAYPTGGNVRSPLLNGARERELAIR